MLYLIATPIGNLGDISLRALETLRSVDYVASEDTRKTGRLLKHFEIQRPLIAFHEHNEERAGERILDLLLEGNSVAMVTDAGTPGISDPGFTLVRRLLQAKDAGEQVDFTMIPGPSAAVMALVLSGLPLHSFTFRGFPPHKRGPETTLPGCGCGFAPHARLLRKPLSGRLILGRRAGSLRRSTGSRGARVDQVVRDRGAWQPLGTARTV